MGERKIIVSDNNTKYLYDDEHALFVCEKKANEYYITVQSTSPSHNRALLADVDLLHRPRPIEAMCVTVGEVLGC